MSSIEELNAIGLEFGLPPLPEMSYEEFGVLFKGYRVPPITFPNFGTREEREEMYRSVLSERKARYDHLRAMLRDDPRYIHAQQVLAHREGERARKSTEDPVLQEKRFSNSIACHRFDPSVLTPEELNVHHFVNIAGRPCSLERSLQMRNRPTTGRRQPPPSTDRSPGFDPSTYRPGEPY